MADGHQVAHGSNHPHAKDRDKGVAGRAQPACCQGGRAEHAHHQRIGEHHQHMGQLRCDQRAGEGQDGAQFVAQGLQHDEFNSVRRLPGESVQAENVPILKSQTPQHKRIIAMTGMTITHEFAL